MRIIYKKWKARNYRLALSKEDKQQFELKILAESLFKDKKKSYAKSFGPKFKNDRLGPEYNALRQSFINNHLSKNETIKVNNFLYLKCIVFKF